MTDEKHRAPGNGEKSDIKSSFAVIGAELGNLLRTLAPVEARQHFKTAHVEALKGLRALVDDRIDRLSSDRKKGTSVIVE